MTTEESRHEANSLVVCGGIAALMRKAAAELESLQKAAGFCDKHKPDGGARTCLVCGCEKLSCALDQISYAVGEPNEMGVSNYSVSYNEDEVVDAVKAKLEALQNENQTLRNAQKACETCDGVTVAEVNKLRTQTAELQKEAQDFHIILGATWKASVEKVVRDKDFPINAMNQRCCDLVDENASLRKQNADLQKEVAEFSTLRDGNWMDKRGACKVCGCDIPHCHKSECDIRKLEQQITSLLFGAEALRAHNAALREALEYIARYSPASSHMRLEDAPEIARKALATQPEDAHES